MNSDRTDHPARESVDAARATLSRRRFLTALTVGLSAACAALAGLPIVGFLFAPLLQRIPQIWRPVGGADGFQIGETVEVSFRDASSLPWAGVTGKTAAWLRREAADQFVAFSVNCSHLGCPVRWLAQADLFMCPCHGGVYYRDGKVASGPPPRGLTQYPVRVRDGQVEIRTTPVPIA